MTVADLLYLLAAAGFATAAGFAYLYQRDFFGSSRQPPAWQFMYAGLGMLAVSMVATVMQAAGRFFFGSVAQITALLGGTFLMVAGYLLWRTFRV